MDNLNQVAAFLKVVELRSFTAQGAGGKKKNGRDGTTTEKHVVADAPRL